MEGFESLHQEDGLLVRGYSLQFVHVHAVPDPDGDDARPGVVQQRRLCPRHVARGRLSVRQDDYYLLGVRPGAMGGATTDTGGCGYRLVGSRRYGIKQKPRR